MVRCFNKNVRSFCLILLLLKDVCNFCVFGKCEFNDIHCGKSGKGIADDAKKTTDLATSLR